GSFLNVVIYRLPRGLSIAKPARSFCPACKHPIAAYDNLPLLSYMLLRGRCRQCGAAISAQYPLVEALTGVLFCVVYHLLFVAHSRVGIVTTAFPADVPLLVSWLVMVATMVACSATDLTSYSIDIRLTNLAIAAGIVLMALWPRAEFLTPPVAGAGGLGVCVAGLVALVMMWLRARREEEDEEEGESVQSATLSKPTPRMPGVITAVVLVGLAAWTLVEPLFDPHTAPIWSLMSVEPALLVAFILTVLVGGMERSADAELEAELEEEQPVARRATLAELGWLSPIIIAGLAAYIFASWIPAFGDCWAAAVRWMPVGKLVPVGGAAYAIHGAIIAATAGWILRIIFTLVFGREALGTGDIYILAAAGATAGWDIALLGLALSVPLALVGWILGLLLKRAIMIPFGPWLALGFVAALRLNHIGADVVRHYAEGIQAAWQHRPDLLVTLGGVMLVGSVGAVMIAKIVRRLIEPESD
ncbi:MAG: A24 family peptidase, partial [Phycisphaerae bacterium]|nr:A24 family peptidase [Phycisphaerae bacterium]